MKLKHLESTLSQVELFEEPKWGLEQYATPPHLAARVLQCAARYEDLEGCAVADLGCGTGMLLIGAVLMDCEEALSVGVDADDDALAIIHNTAVIVPGEEGMKDIRIVEAIYQAAKTNSKINL